ncbi:hypothetical protein PENTCL1PPCAC_4105, partial [Pristionchus entomophagus]
LQMSPRPARSRKTTARLQDSYVELKRLKVVTGDLPSSRNASHASPALMGTTGGEEHSGYSPIMIDRVMASNAPSVGGVSKVGSIRWEVDKDSLVQGQSSPTVEVGGMFW